MSGQPDSPAQLSSEQLFRRYATFVARFLLQLGVSTPDLDDVVQEVFLVAHARGGYTEGRAKPTSYLGSIAVHAAQSHRRKQEKRKRREHADADALSALPSSWPDPHETLESRAEIAKIRAALATLSEELCAVLVLVELEGESCASVAAAMNCSVGTVYWRVHTARKRFLLALTKTSKAQRAEAVSVGKGASP